MQYLIWKILLMVKTYVVGRRMAEWIVFTKQKRKVVICFIKWPLFNPKEQDFSLFKEPFTYRTCGDGRLLPPYLSFLKMYIQRGTSPFKIYKIEMAPRILTLWKFWFISNYLHFVSDWQTLAHHILICLFGKIHLDFCQCELKDRH